jgi:hypothetical protein
MQVGDADTQRLKSLGRFHAPNSGAVIESASVAPGHSVVNAGSAGAGYLHLTGQAA